MPSSSTSSGKRTKSKAKFVSGKVNLSKLCMTCHQIVSSTAVANENIVINNYCNRNMFNNKNKSIELTIEIFHDQYFHSRL